jgi:adenylosuccinate synthase
MTMREPHAAVVVDLGFGDAGKGLVTEALVRRLGAHTVVRFNGGAQAGHNVVGPDGRHHTFAQIGAGSFMPGVRTFLSRHTVVHPTALLVEAEHLARKGVPSALERVSISEDALVVTPLHQAACRLRELARGSARHGSCGVGIGEVMGDALAHPDEAIRARDLGDEARLFRALRRTRERKRAALDAELRAAEGAPGADAERRVLEDDGPLAAWVAALRALPGGLVVDDGALAARITAPGAVVFEGAQGVLLDEWRGLHPYTTWSTCTFDNALELLLVHGHEGSVTRVGVVRTYATRHGPGPFPTEQPHLRAALPEPHNGAGPWQGDFRVGWLDLVLLRYALEVSGGADGLVVTHVDAMARLPEWRVADAYGGAFDARFFDGPGERARRIRPGVRGDLGYQEALGEALRRVAPVYEAVARADAPDAPGRLLRRVEEALGARVLGASRGPRASDLGWLAGAGPSASSLFASKRQSEESAP